MPTNTYEERIESATQRMEDYVEEGKILEDHKDTILEFDRFLKLNDYSGSRRYKYLVNLRQMAETLDVPFEDVSKRDIEDIVLDMKERDLAAETIRGKKSLIKRFYRWTNDDGDYPKCVDWLNTGASNNNDKLPDKLLTEENIQELQKAANSSRDRALISILWETGARIGELIDLTIGDLEDHRHGYKVKVDGKTGERRLPLIESEPHLNNWLMDHPKRDEDNAPLWVNIGNTNTGKKMSYRSIRKMLDVTAERANVSKPTNPHHFRHSRATYMASQFTEHQMCEWFGWVQGSDEPAKYVHMSGRDIDSDYARMHGIKDEEKPEESELAPQECPRCNKQVPPGADYCYQCGKALSVEAAQEMEEDKEEVSKDFTQLAKEKPEVLDDMQDFMDIVKLMNENEEIMEEFKRMLKERID